MKHRVFISVNLPEDIKKELVQHQEKIEELFTSHRNEVSRSRLIRWTKKDNFHITLIFIGYLLDKELLKVCKTIKEVVSQNFSFSINLKKILYGPPKKMPPRMIWGEGEKSLELGKIQKDLENSLLTPSIKGKESEARPHTPHITLGRIKPWEFRQIEPEERPEVNEEINLSFEVNSIEVMESVLKKGGPEYTVLESFKLKE